MALRIVASALVLAVVLAGSAPASAADPTLSTVHSVTADDGSARIVLTFKGQLPDTRVIHNASGLVHIIFVGASMAPHEKISVAPAGQILADAFNNFAGVGFRLDLQLRRKVPIRVEPLPKANAIVVHVPAAHSDLEAKVAQPAVTATGLQTVYIPLNYADVSEVAGLLVKGAQVASLDGFTPQSPFAAPTPNSSSYSSGGSSAATGRTPTYVTLPTANIMTKDVPQGQRLDDKVAVDRRLNAVIITGTPAEIAHDRAVIGYVDVPTPSILIEAEVVELTENAAQDLGLDLSPGGGPLATASSSITSGVKATSTVALRAELNAMSENGTAKILARPRILTLNARAAAILSGEAVPIVNAVLVPSGGGTIIENQVQYINVGVSLQILPRVSADGQVTTQVFSEVSSIIDYVGTAPRIAVRQGLTSGIVGDGESLLVGGLMQQTEITSLSKVPGLGDIPLIGELFRNRSTSSQTTNLYLVVTPHIINEKSPPPLPAVLH